MGRTLRILALIAVLLVSAVPLTSEHVSDISDAISTSDSISIYELDPYGEGFTLINTSQSTVNLRGWYVGDGEGTVSFKKTIELGAGETVTFVNKTNTNWFTSRDGVIVYSKSSDMALATDNFTLANGGDELFLYAPGGKLADAVCYGNSEYSGDGWNGAPVKISSKKYLLRTSSEDTDTAGDWTAVKPGWTDNWFSSLLSFAADVTPFTFPESKGIPVLDTLKSAESTIYISIYLISSENIAAVLMEKARSGVDVRILVDGGVLNGDSTLTSEYKLLRHVDAAGADVYVINDGEKTRYSYLHNKYAVIDGDTTIITSENWTRDNIGDKGNRGWGAIIESGQYADFMTSVFRNDCTTEYGDVVPFAAVYEGNEIKYDAPAPVESDLGMYDTVTFSASVTPVLSPDSSWDALEWFISNSKEYLYVEQMDLKSELSVTYGETPIAWMDEAAKRGVDVRFILDASQADGEDHEDIVKRINSETNIKSVAVNGKSGFKLIHNKGLISGDLTWVGSVNWTTNSLLNNRESAVIIKSQDIADYFKAYFRSDFGVTAESVEKDGLQMNVKVNYTSEGKFVSMSALGPDGCTYVWDLGNGVTRETDVGIVLFEAPEPGTYTATVSVKGTDFKQSFEYTVGEKAPDSADVNDTDGEYSRDIYLAAVLVILLGLIVSVLRGKKNPHGRGRNSRNASRRRR